MRLAMTILTVLLIISCKHAYVGKRAIRIDHHLESQGHETVELNKKYIADYDYRIVNNEIHVEGIFTCKENTNRGAWTSAEIKINYVFSDEKGIILGVETVNIYANDLCVEHKFKRTFPYLKDYKAVTLELRGQVRG